MLNALPRQTYSRDVEATQQFNARIDAYTKRMLKVSRASDPVPARARNAVAEDENSDAAPLVLPLTVLPRRPARLTALQEWEGYVTAVHGGTFDADLIDLTNRKRNESERSSFLVSDLSEDDRRALREGSVFRWVIGYQTTAYGTRQRVSEIYFRREPSLSNEHAERVDSLSTALLRKLGLT